MILESIEFQYETPHYVWATYRRYQLRSIIGGNYIRYSSKVAKKAAKH